MAITKIESNVTPRGFLVNGNSADLSGCEVLKSGTAGVSIYVERIYISAGAAVTVTIGEGKTGAAVTTVICGPIYLAANGFAEMIFSRPIMLAAATDLTVDASGAENVTIICQGYVE